MPQMAPLSWLTLYMFFTLIFLMMNPMNYFLTNKTPRPSKLKINYLKTNWKW